MFVNPILNSDSYKASHFLQYPPGTERVCSYIEARGYQAPFKTEPEVVFFGLQAFIQQYLDNPITRSHIAQAGVFFAAHGLPFNEAGFRYILDTHGGYWPIEVSALPEGSRVCPGTPLLQIMNTDTQVPWVTSYLETALLRAIWYPTTVATLSREAKKIIRKYFDETSDEDAAAVDFKLHDFGARGTSSMESAALGGMAHLINFKGSDTLSGILAATQYYSADMAGFSIPAAEHSTITSWGERFEVDAYRNMLDKFAGPGKLVAVVSDSWDIMNAAKNIWGGELRDRVVNNGGTVVIRPDSGDPIETVLGVLDILGERFSFGVTINTKGYRVLPKYIRIIQGDGIDLEMIAIMLATLKDCGWSADNIAFGMGGGLLQQVNRDSLKFAMKCNAVQVGGAWRDVYKRPAGDPSKWSKRGRLAVQRLITPGGLEYATMPLNDCPESMNMLQLVYRDGMMRRRQTFDEIRELARV